MQALAALLIPARIGGLLFLLEILTNTWRRSARPEAVKQVAEIDRGDGSVVYGGGRAERAASGGRYRAVYRDGVAYRGDRFCGHRRDLPNPNLAYRGKAMETQGGTCGASRPAAGLLQCVAPHATGIYAA